MKETLKDYFYFSKSEKNGLIVLLIILILAISFPLIYKHLPSRQKNTFSNFENEIQAFSQSLVEVEEPEYKNKLDQYIIQRYDSINLFFFNPNNTSADDFLKLGLTEKQIKTIINYRDKGGKFTVKDDFKKIYGIRHQQYQILRPYILLPDNNHDKTSERDKAFQQNQNQSLFMFDPNTATDEEFKSLGLTDNNIKTIRNYQAKIGKFKSKDDFKKTYGLSEETYNRLEPYLYIEQAKEKPEEIQKVEINSAGIAEFEKLKGIGNYHAQAIVRYREKLGGFVKSEQLLELKNITPELFETIKPNLIVDKSKIKSISLNFSEVEELSAHPYLNFYQAKEIVKFRSTNGSFTDKKQLLINKILMEETYKKIEPYLSLN